MPNGISNFYIKHRSRNARKSSSLSYIMEYYINFSTFSTFDFESSMLHILHVKRAWIWRVNQFSLLLNSIPQKHMKIHTQNIKPTKPSFGIWHQIQMQMQVFRTSCYFSALYSNHTFLPLFIIVIFLSFLFETQLRVNGLTTNKRTDR